MILHGQCLPLQTGPIEANSLSVSSKARNFGGESNWDWGGGGEFGWIVNVDSRARVSTRVLWSLRHKDFMDPCACTTISNMSPHWLRPQYTSLLDFVMSRLGSRQVELFLLFWSTPNGDWGPVAYPSPLERERHLLDWPLQAPTRMLWAVRTALMKRSTSLVKRVLSSDEKITHQRGWGPMGVMSSCYLPWETCLLLYLMGAGQSRATFRAF